MHSSLHVQDHAISIAIIHHFSTEERRCEAVKVSSLPQPSPSQPPLHKNA